MRLFKDESEEEKESHEDTNPLEKVKSQLLLKKFNSKVELNKEQKLKEFFALKDNEVT